MSDHDMARIICKFGGSSVASLENWQNIKTVVENHLEGGNRVVLVCSALKGVTNLLERAIHLAVTGKNFEDATQEIHNKHIKLASDMALATDVVDSYMMSMTRLLKDCVAHGDLPRLRAAILSHGELMSTVLGAAYLKQCGLPITWMDARELLIAKNTQKTSGSRFYLGAQCDDAPCEAAQAKLMSAEPVVITQGFLVSTPTGETALLGRGGSDTSAAYLAAVLDADCLEIWTDVPGMFSANPHQVADARLIKQLSYEEAEIMAKTGAKVLHPRCVRPAQNNEIPIRIKCTAFPEYDGTVIGTGIARELQTGLSALTGRSGLLLMEAEVGQACAMNTLNELTEQFLKRELETDFLSAGQGRVHTVIDPLLTPISASELEDLQDELQSAVDVEVRQNLASMSLIGQSSSALFRAVGTMVSGLDERHIHAVGSSSSMDVTILANRAEVDEWVSSMHHHLLSQPEACESFGHTWTEIKELMQTRQYV